MARNRGHVYTIVCMRMPACLISEVCGAQVLYMKAHYDGVAGIHVACLITSRSKASKLCTYCEGRMLGFHASRNILGGRFQLQLHGSTTWRIQTDGQSQCIRTLSRKYPGTDVVIPTSHWLVWGRLRVGSPTWKVLLRVVRQTLWLMVVLSLMVHTHLSKKTSSLATWHAVS